MTKIFPRILVVLLAQLCLMANVFAAQGDVIRIRPDQPGRYVVVKGDTLWDISGRFLEDPWLWPQIWEVNPQIENPDLIYPGDLIELTYVDGSPVLTLQRGSALPSNVPGNLPTRRLSPQVRREPLTNPIPAISLADIDSYLSRNRVVSALDFENSPYILDSESGNLLSAAGDTVFARGQWSDQVLSYEIVRQGKEYFDLETGEALGIEAQLIAVATISSRDNDLAKLIIDEVEVEVRQGDRLIATEARVFNSTYSPEPPDFQVDARILDISSDLEYGSAYDTLVLNVGRQSNIEVGHLLTVQKPDRIIRDDNVRENLIFREKVSFSGKKFATVLIYRVFERTSLGLVLSAAEPIRLEDRVVAP